MNGLQSSNVVPLVTQATLTEAWEMYAEQARQVADDPRLLFDKGFNEELARRHDRWRRLFLASER